MDDVSGESRSTEVFYNFPNSPDPRGDFIGDRRTFAGLSLLEWIFLTVSTVNIAVTIGLTLERLIDYGRTNDLDFTYALLLLINSLFCLFFVYNGVLRELTFEIVAFAGSVVIVLLYCIFEYALNSEKRNTIKLIRLIFSCVSAPLNLYLAYKVAWQFGWLEFRIVGASESLQNMFRSKKRFFSFQKFDFQASVSFAIFALDHGVKIIKNEPYFLTGGIVLSIIWLIVGAVAVEMEWKWLTYLLFITGFIEPAYIIYKIVMGYISNNVPDIIQYPMLVEGNFAVLIRIILLCELYLVYKNFNKGLNDAAFRELVASETTSLLPGRIRRHHVCCCAV